MTTAILTCKHCGATENKQGKPFNNRGALALHEKKHCEKNPANSSSATAETKMCCPNPSIRLLRVTDQRELFMMHHGFKKLCMNCEECSK